MIPGLLLFAVLCTTHLIGKCKGTILVFRTSNKKQTLMPTKNNAGMERWVPS
jgi:hypothetical protein